MSRKVIDPKERARDIIAHVETVLKRKLTRLHQIDVLLDEMPELWGNAQRARDLLEAIAGDIHQ
jgi:hypothetical protein